MSRPSKNDEWHFRYLSLTWRWQVQLKGPPTSAPACRLSDQPT